MFKAYFPNYVSDNVNNCYKIEESNKFENLTLCSCVDL